MTVAPLVRVVVVDWNGGELSLECLRRLLQTEWPATRLEVVLVDNGSEHSVVDRVHRELPVVRVVQSPINRGFAGGCNLALRDLAGIDYVALVNNDALVTRGWLAPLAAALDADPGVGAACPKILFEGTFVEITLASETFRRGRGDQRGLGVRVSGATVDCEDVWDRVQRRAGFWGPEQDAHGRFEWTGARATLHVPVPPGGLPASCALELAADRPTRVTIDCGGASQPVTVGPGRAWCPLTLAGPAFDVVNNVGSELVADGYGADRGYLERDQGQYQRAEDVFAWCGAAVLLRTRYLHDVGPFDERLFLYYEDLELSWRGRARGWRYRYVPESVVRHVHAATAGERSPLADYYNERNRLLVLLRHANATDFLRALVRYVGVTASYGVRDVVAPIARGDAPRPASVTRRLRALDGAMRGTRAALRARRARLRSGGSRSPG